MASFVFMGQDPGRGPPDPGARQHFGLRPRREFPWGTGFPGLHFVVVQLATARPLAALISCQTADRQNRLGQTLRVTNYPPSATQPVGPFLEWSSS